VNIIKGFLLILGFWLAACTPLSQTAVLESSIQSLVPTQTETPLPSQTATRIPSTSTAVPTAAEILHTVCCPLEEETLDSLRLILINPLKIPPIGHDDGHHGVDFAYFQRGERESIQGIEVYAILSGKVVLTLEDDIPYGYTVMIETSLSELSENLQQTLLAGYIEVPDEVVTQGQCPPMNTPILTGEMSVYHLYAHLETRPSIKPGDSVQCGELLGTVGNSGLSSNPHLHLETRLGPSGADLSTMAFYNPTYSEKQRSTYCLWRMSGYYQLFDPFIIFETENWDT